MKKCIYLLVIVIFIIACKKENLQESPNTTPSEEYFDEYHNEVMINDLKEKIIFKGDTTAFWKLADIYMISGHQSEFLYYSLRIAEDYEYHEGYYIAYSILHTDVINPTNENTNKLANYYLLKAYEEGNKSAKRNIKLRFSKNVPGSREYWLMINK